MEFKDHGTILDLKGSHEATIPSGQTAQIDYIASNNFLVTGCDYETFNHNFGDKVTFQVIHPVTQVVLGQFATNIFVRSVAKYEFYKATIYAGMIIRVIYQNVGPNDAKINLNLHTHKEKV